MATIQVSGSISPKTNDTPLDERGVINSIGELDRIERPFVGLLFYVKDTKKVFKVTELDVDERKINKYEEVGAANESLRLDLLKKQNKLTPGGQNVRIENDVISVTPVDPSDVVPEVRKYLDEKGVSVTSEMVLTPDGSNLQAIINKLQSMFAEPITKKDYEDLAERGLLEDKFYYIFEDE